MRIIFSCLIFLNFLAGLVYVEHPSKDNIAILIGISSWVAASGYPEWPNVYGRVSRVNSWITEITG